jgi:hypothetical protein
MMRRRVEEILPVQKIVQGFSRERNAMAYLSFI